MKKPLFSNTHPIAIVLFLALIVNLNCQDTTDNPIIININENTDSTPAPVSYPPWLLSSQTEYHKFLKDKYNYFISPKGNKFWVCALNLAWNQLKHKILRGNNATFQNMTQLQSHMIDNLNSQVFTKDQLSEEAYYVHAGYGNKAVEKINVDVKKKFPLRTLSDLNYTLADDDFISFAYLFKNFQYPTPFADHNTFSFKDVQVRAFQSKTSKHRSQLYYKYYNHPDDFMIGIKTQNSNDEIILWKTNMSEINNINMEKFLHVFEMFYKMQSNQLGSSDRFIMPVIDLDYTRNHQELVGLEFLNEGFEKTKMTTVTEKVKLKVTKEGVKLQAEGVIIGTRTMVIVDRQFYLNNDFWIILKQKNKQPYLISLISSVEQKWVE